ncbi:hypothetical protein HEB29_000413 [Streptomyces fulvorobeus]|uniref:Uncharacterized protein n=1 Tax=Streptomyces fulvorobeus TaxID=284028 RepID=A0A7Y9KV60_9ACTN|nr:hypothetical protein [Streptomyces fulvorobeus]
MTGCLGDPGECLSVRRRSSYRAVPAVRRCGRLFRVRWPRSRLFPRGAGGLNEVHGYLCYAGQADVRSPHGLAVRCGAGAGPGPHDRPCRAFRPRGPAGRRGARCGPGTVPGPDRGCSARPVAGSSRTSADGAVAPEGLEVGRGAGLSTRPAAGGPCAVADGLAAALPPAAAGRTDWAELRHLQMRVGPVHAASDAAGGTCYPVPLPARTRGRLCGPAGPAAVSAGCAVGGHLAFRQTPGTDDLVSACMRRPWPAAHSASRAAGARRVRPPQPDRLAISASTAPSWRSGSGTSARPVPPGA